MGRFARAGQSDAAVRSLLDELHRLDRHAGEPTVSSMAKAIGVSRQTIYNIFRGPAAPSWGYIELLCEFLGGNKEVLRMLWIAARESEDSDGPLVTNVGLQRDARPGESVAVEDLSARPAAPDEPGSSRDRTTYTDLTGPGFPLAARHRWRGPDRLRRLEEDLRQELARLESLGTSANSPDALSVRHGLSSIQHLRGRFVDACEGLTDVLALECGAYGHLSPQTLTTRYNLTFVLYELHRFQEAVEQFRTILEIEMSLDPPDYEQMASVRVQLADTLLHSGHLAESLEHYDEVLRSAVHLPEAAVAVAALQERLANTRFGRLKSWSDRGVHGYIVADDGREYVFSEDALKPAAADDDTDGRPPAGTRVRFEINRNRNGWLEAVEVMVVND